jgi:hypothetical protein
MAAPLIYSSSPCKLNTTVMAATDLRLSANIASQVYQHSGNLFPSVAVLSGAIPRIAFKTPIKDALTVIGTGLLALTNLDFMLAKFSNSTFIKATTSVHTKWNASSGCAYISGWSIGQGGICLADVDVVPLSTDGTTHPLTRSDNNAMLTLSSEPILHTLGPLSVNGSVITGLNQLSVAMNHTLDVRVSDGDLYPRNAALLAGSPTITGEHLDPATLLTTLSLIGVNISANVIAYWKSFDVTTQIVSTANSVSAAIASGRIVAENIDAGQNNPAKSAIHVIPLSSTATHPLVTSIAATAPST